MENKRSIKYKKVATFLFANFLINSTSFIAEGRNDNKITAAVNLSMNSFSLINCGIKTFLTFPFQIKLKFNFKHTSYYANKLMYFHLLTLAAIVGFSEPL